MFQWALITAPFWQQCKMSITHCMLCRNRNFWKRYCMIEGRSPLTMKGRKTTFPRKERCMFRGLPSILQGYPFLKEAMPFLEGKLQFVNDESKVYFDMKVFCQGPETDCKNLRKTPKKKQFQSKILRKKMVHFWCTFDALLMHFFKVMHFWCTFDALFSYFDALLMHFSKVHQKCIKTASKVHQNCIKTASKVHQKCIKSAPDFSQNFALELFPFWSFSYNSCSHKNGPRGYEECMGASISLFKQFFKNPPKVFGNSIQIFSHIHEEKHQELPKHIIIRVAN